MFSVGVFAAIFNQEKILLCHRKDKNLWNLPGGTMEKGETPWDAVKRKVKEETGLEVRVVKLVGVYSHPEINDIVFLFLCQIIGGKQEATDEADELKYFLFNEIPPNTVSRKPAQNIKDIIKKDPTACITLEFNPKETVQRQELIQEKI